MSKVSNLMPGISLKLLKKPKSNLFFRFCFFAFLAISFIGLMAGFYASIGSSLNVKNYEGVNKMDMKKLVQEFWNYFESNQEKFLSINSMSLSDRDILFKNLSTYLKHIHEDITFEFGYLEKGHGELTLSADGIENAFPYVEEIYKNKPLLNNWVIHKFRQPILDIDESSINIDGIEVKFSEMRFGFMEKDGGIIVLLFIPGYSEDISAYETIKFLSLDSSLGEYDAVKKVKFCAGYDLNKYKGKGHKPLKFLKEDFDKMYASIKEKTKIETEIKF